MVKAEQCKVQSERKTLKRCGKRIDGTILTYLSHFDVSEGQEKIDRARKDFEQERNWVVLD